jgi:hypothetical protein
MAKRADEAQKVEPLAEELGMDPVLLSLFFPPQYARLMDIDSATHQAVFCNISPQWDIWSRRITTNTS